MVSEKIKFMFIFRVNLSPGGTGVGGGRINENLKSRVA